MFGDLKMFARYAWALRGYLRDPLTADQCRQVVAHQLAVRDESFLTMIRGIYDHPHSPYRKLLVHAGIEFSDIEHLVRQYGVEGALSDLYEAGVYISLDEFKGRQPIRRHGLYLQVQPKDFDNPSMVSHYLVRTGGSRGGGMPLLINLDLLTHEAVSHSLFVTAFEAENRPMGLWRPLPPAIAGMKNVLRHAKLGKSAERWFTQNRMTLSRGSFKYFLLTNYTIYGSWLWGRPLPSAEYVPLTEAFRVAEWLAMKKREGTPAHLDTTCSSGVRVCLAAKENGLDICGTLFRLGGEPYTRTKAQAVADMNCRAVCHYSTSETGHIGIACAAPEYLDDVHLLRHKLAVIQKKKSVGVDGMGVLALLHTTLLPIFPKIMLNVESGDYGVLSERSCGCPLQELGLKQHLHTIRSYEKLTSEGMGFIGNNLLRVVEEVLPAHFGGHTTDYQFIEEEDQNGLPKVSIVISPRVGKIDQAYLVNMVLESIRSNAGGNRIVADIWQEVKTIRVVRCEPYATSAAKILPLHILKE